MHFQAASVRIELAGGNAVIYKYASSQAASFVKVRYGDAAACWGVGWDVELRGQPQILCAASALRVLPPLQLLVRTALALCCVMPHGHASTLCRCCAPASRFADSRSRSTPA